MSLAAVQRMPRDADRCGKRDLLFLGDSAQDAVQKVIHDVLKKVFVIAAHGPSPCSLCVNYELTGGIGSQFPVTTGGR